MSKDTCVVVVNWNGKEYLRSCLNSLRKQTYKNFEVVLVDNNSSDGSTVFVRNNYPEINIIKVPYNSGFARGNNIGFQYALRKKSIKYLICLNNDTKTRKEWLVHLIERAKSDSKIGMVASKVIFGKTPVIQSAGELLATDLGFVHRGIGADVSGFDRSCEVVAPYGASFLVKRQLVEEVGMFDETFFCYIEEGEWALRSRFLGWSVVYEPNSVVYHFHSGSKGSLSSFKAFYTARNTILLGIKLYPWSEFLTRFFNSMRRVKVYFVNKNESMIRHKKKHIKIRLLFAVFRGILSSLVHIPHMLNKRREVYSRDNLSSSKAREIMRKFTNSKDVTDLKNYLNHV